MREGSSCGQAPRHGGERAEERSNPAQVSSEEPGQLPELLRSAGSVRGRKTTALHVRDCVRARVLGMCLPERLQVSNEY